MNDNVTPLPGRALTVDNLAGRPVDDTVRQLETLLEAARAGKFQFLAWAVIGASGSASGATATARRDLEQTIGVLASLSANITQALNEAEA